ncbi:MAG: hypothetical protein IPL22_10770 [Bacteroidetes bacterium]|nr:hypothetical protein [Bacteroidota bacterium]
MKKLIPALLISGMISSVFVSCGPSAEEKQLLKNTFRDSIAAVQQAIMDSTLAAQQQAMQDSMAAVQATADSLAAIQAVEDSIAAAKSNKPKPKPKNQTLTILKFKPRWEELILTSDC